MALVSLLETEGIATRGKTVGFYAFGSGSSSIFFKGVINEQFHNGFKLKQRIFQMEEVSPERYELIRIGQETLKEPEGFLLQEIDKKKYRHYIKQ